MVVQFLLQRRIARSICVRNAAMQEEHVRAPIVAVARRSAHADAFLHVRRNDPNVMEYGNEVRICDRVNVFNALQAEQEPPVLSLDPIV